MCHFRAADAYVWLHRDRPVDICKVILGMVTAPGSGELPWDRSLCKVKRSHTCSGDLGCQVEKRAADVFNWRAQRQWTALHGFVAQRVRRRYPGGLVMVFRAWEPQKRGVNHVHPVLGYTTPLERAAARYYFELIEAHAVRFGFGPISGRKPSVLTGEQAAAYAAAYCFTASSKGNGQGKRQVQDWMTSEQVTPDRPFWIRPQLMQLSGASMRTARLRRRKWALLTFGGCFELDGLVVDPQTGEVLLEMPPCHIHGPPA
jgi:hypothetical protein